MAEFNPGSGPGPLKTRGPEYAVDMPTGGSGEDQIKALQDQLSEAYRRALDAESVVEAKSQDRNSPIGKMFRFIEEGGVPEALRSPEAREALEEDHEELMRSLFEPVITYANDARTRFVPQGWPVQHEWSSIKRIDGSIRTKAGIRRPYKPEKVNIIDAAAKNKAERLKEDEYQHNIYVSAVSADIKRLGAFTAITEHAFGPMSMYFSGKDMLGINPRRISVMSMDDIRLAFNDVKDKKLNEFRKAQKGEPGSDPAKKIENAPEFFTEGFSDTVKKYTAEMVDASNVIAAINTRNPFDPDGQEMRLTTTTTEMEFFGRLFQRMERTNEHGEVQNLDKIEQTSKIRIYFNEEGRQILVNKDGSPIGKYHHYKDVWKHLLSYENTTSSEIEHKRLMSLMMAYVMLDARTKLHEICKKVTPSSMRPETIDELNNLIESVDSKAKEIVDDWDSPHVSTERQAAAYANEINSMIQIGTLNIANLGHINHWRIEEVRPKKFAWKYLDEVGDPDMALDAVSAMFSLAHEYTYATVKNRIATPLIPPADPRFAEKTINICASGGRDTELLNYAKRSIYIARGYGIIGMFANELADNPAWQQGEQIRRDLGFTCNPEVVQILEQYMFGVPTVFDGEVFPMPIIPFFRSQTLFDAMHVSKDKTIGDMMQKDRKLMTEIDWEQYHPFGSDSTAVVGKFTTDLTSLMYGAADPKTMDALFGVPTEALRRTIKAADIGGRAEVKRFKYKDPSTGEESTRTINKKFYEITFSAYLAIAYLSFYKYGLWDGNEKFNTNLELLKDGDKVNKIPGLKDYIESASYLLKNKQGFGDYNGSFVLILNALSEFVKGIGIKADQGYETARKLREKEEKIISNK